MKTSYLSESPLLMNSFVIILVNFEVRQISGLLL